MPLLLAAWLLVPRAAIGAQVAPTDSAAIAGTGRVVGTVFDSLAMRPLAGANVWTPDGRHSALTDTAGRFVLDSVEAGPRVVMAGHPAADSIGIYSLGGNVRVEPGADAVVTLALPSYESIAGAMCRTAGDDMRRGATIFGVVRDAVTGRALPAATVTLSWLWLQDAEGRQVDNPGDVRFAETQVATDGAGAYYVCGIPGDQDVLVRAEAADSATSGVLSIVVPERRLLRRDLLVLAPGVEANGVVIATVRADGKPLGDARVAVDDGRPVTSGRDGRVVMPTLRAGTRMVTASAIGYPPARSEVDIVAGDTARVVLSLGRASNLLDTLVVRRSRVWSEVERRRMTGLGYSVMGPELTRMPGIRSVFDMIPSVATGGRGTIDYMILLPKPFQRIGDISRGLCVANVFLDGRYVPDMAEVTSYRPDELFAVEVFARVSMVPAQYKRFADSDEDCGVVLVWTRR